MDPALPTRPFLPTRGRQGENDRLHTARRHRQHRRARDRRPGRMRPHRTRMELRRSRMRRNRQTGLRRPGRHPTRMRRRFVVNGHRRGSLRRLDVVLERDADRLEPADRMHPLPGGAGPELGLVGLRPTRLRQHAAPPRHGGLRRRSLPAVVSVRAARGDRDRPVPDGPHRLRGGRPPRQPPQMPGDPDPDADTPAGRRDRARSGRLRVGAAQTRPRGGGPHRLPVHPHRAVLHMGRRRSRGRRATAGPQPTGTRHTPG